MPVRRRSGLRLQVVLAACLVTSLSCGGVYEEVAPAQKRVVEAVLVPDFVRGGESAEVVAFIDVDPTNVYLSDFSFGAGIGVSSTATAERCTTTASAPADFETANPLRVCFELQVEAGVEAGEREATFDLRAAGEAVVAQASFFVLPRLR